MKHFEYPSAFDGLIVGEKRTSGGKNYTLTKIEVYHHDNGTSFNTYWRRDGLKNSRMMVLPKAI